MVDISLKGLHYNVISFSLHVISRNSVLQCCLCQPQVDAAASLARRAVRACPKARPAWLLLARCYAAQQAYASALITLNVVPTPPLPRDELELLHVVPPPKGKDITRPHVSMGCN